MKHAKSKIAVMLGLGTALFFFQNCGGFNTPDPGYGPSSPNSSTIPNVGDLIWSDEFNSLSFYNASTATGNWSPTCIGGLSSLTQQGGVGWGSEYDINPLTSNLGINPLKVANGILTLRTDRAPASIQASIGGRQYTSAAIRTVSPSFGYGYYEMRAQLPGTNGLWPAFWLLPADGAWPPEIDIVETLGKYPSTVYTTVHSTVAFPNYDYTAGANHYVKGVGAPLADVSAAYHTYGMDYRANSLAWYFDGRQIYQTVTPSDLVGRQMYIIVDTAIGGWDGNDVDGTTRFPADFNIDYIRVYKSNPN